MEKIQNNLRACSFGDIDFILTLKELCFKWYIEKIYGWDIDVQRQKTINEFNRLADNMKIISVDKKDIGITTFFEENGVYVIGMLMIHPDFQNKGIATSILNNYIDIAKSENKIIIVKTYVKNPARNLYERLGFSLDYEDTTHAHYKIDFSKRVSSLGTIQLCGDEYEKCSNIWDIEKDPFAKQWKEEIAKGNRLVYVCKINDEFVGECDIVLHKNGYTDTDKTVYLSRLKVKREFRGKGIGSSLVQYLLKLFKIKGYTHMTLGVDTDNYAAVHLYEKCGFKVYATDEDEYGEFYKMIAEL